MSILSGTTVTRANTVCSGRASKEDVARRLYDAEIALHYARQTAVDAWIAAAYDRLHEAVEEYVANADATN
jgi:hypothetical protein